MSVFLWGNEAKPTPKPKAETRKERYIINAVMSGDAEVGFCRNDALREMIEDARTAHGLGPEWKLTVVSDAHYLMQSGAYEYRLTFNREVPA